MANGSFPVHPVPLSAIENAPFIVCCDGAADRFIALGNAPHAIVGDCDSISEQNKTRFAHILHQEKEQETNDLTKSVRFCIKNGRKNIAIVGATGMREDHTLGNISLLAEYVLSTGKVRMITDRGIFTPIASTTQFHSFEGQKVSLFAIDRCPITTSGLEYNVSNRIFSNWWQGTLNRATGQHFTIETDGRVIVFQAFDP